MLKTAKDTPPRLTTKLRRRLPPARETFRAYLASLVPVVAWSVWRMLYEGIPAWANQLRAWDLLGAIAYVQAFALLEAAAVLLPLLLLAAVLPPEWLRDKFAALATGLVYVSAGWFVLAHSNDDLLRTGTFRELSPWIGGYLVSLPLAAILLHGSPRIRGAISAYVERVTVLASAYLLVGLAAVAIVVIRNL